MWVVAYDKIGRQGAIDRVAPAVGQLGLQDARGAGAQEDADALRPVFAGGGGHGVGKAVLRQAQERQAVVAAIEGGQFRGKPHGVHAGDFTDEGRQVDRVEGARRQPAAALAQCGQGLRQRRGRCRWSR